MGKVYKHTQIGYLMILIIGTGLYLLLNFFYLHGFNALLVAVFAVLAVCLVLFAALTVNVDSRDVTLRFGIGVIRKKFSITGIETAGVVRNPWYYGWGIRKTPDGWLYNVSGLIAVELRMKSGEKYRIGTDDPLRLLNAIEAVISEIKDER
ncbi:MAG: hypothetical protein L0213_01035 [Candidatus Dadabacteria bacterium]|nr:hypothetical protein [Candidatus Dadabacteria bacterium]